MVPRWRSRSFDHTFRKSLKPFSTFGLAEEETVSLRFSDRKLAGRREEKLIQKIYVGPRRVLSPKLKKCSWYAKYCSKGTFRSLKIELNLKIGALLCVAHDATDRYTLRDCPRRVLKYSRIRYCESENISTIVFNVRYKEEYLFPKNLVMSYRINVTIRSETIRSWRELFREGRPVSKVQVRPRRNWPPLRGVNRLAFPLPGRLWLVFQSY